METVLKKKIKRRLTYSLCVGAVIGTIGYLYYKSLKCKEQIDPLQSNNTNIEHNTNSKDEEISSQNECVLDECVIGGILQIKQPSRSSESLIKYWRECNIESLYNDSLIGLIGIIKQINFYNQTVKLETRDKIQHIIPIKSCISIKYEESNDIADNLLICGYIYNTMNINKSINIPPIILSLCYEFFHSDDLKLVPIDYNDDKQKELTVSRKASVLSTYLTEILSLNNKIGILYIKKVNYEILSVMIEYLEYHNGVKPEEIAKPIRSVKMERIVADKWDSDFINKFSKKMVFQVILGSNYLGITDLLHLGSAKIATLIKGKSPEEIKNILADDSDDSK